jgi:predicted transcriptional regulator
MSRNKVDLENQIRKKINTHITEYPGVSFSTLKKFYELKDSTLRYHLNYLERAERITVKLEGGQLHYYSYNSNATAANRMSGNPKTPELSPRQEQILNIIKHYPLINQTELIQKTVLKRHILIYDIAQLINWSMVRKVKQEKNVCYEYITDELLQYEMLKLLAIRFLNNEIDEQTFLKLKNKLKNQ